MMKSESAHSDSNELSDFVIVDLIAVWKIGVQARVAAENSRSGKNSSFDKQ